MNFKGYVALPLEAQAKKVLKKNEIENVSISADSIECGAFVSVMVLLLYIEKKHENALDFVKKCSPYLGLSGNDIPCEIAFELYTRFDEIIND